MRNELEIRDAIENRDPVHQKHPREGIQCVYPFGKQRDKFGEGKCWLFGAFV